MGGRGLSVLFDLSPMSQGREKIQEAKSKISLINQYRILVLSGWNMNYETIHLYGGIKNSAKGLIESENETA